FDCFNRTNTFVADKQVINCDTINKVNNNKKFFTVPFIPIISDKIKRFLKHVPCVKMAYRGINKLNKFIKAQKDRLLQSSQSNLVYRIDCKDCDAPYVGQTSSCLKTRINEHRNHINRNTTQLSVKTFTINIHVIV
ncbi:hypothetical protein ALC60_07968, partial [Trachymyrmex zeteki]